ncbi:Detected protein of confused Function [Hibiscus syriacus]|uniref:RING-type E3 ubiquitin transferase n=1 Tax=Hibiscus syriacus TaxID=106335 RepID=A0A6A2WVC9_HIBSY|nr:Detected protein of confused Function [Hibiscus syriacus]
MPDPVFMASGQTYERASIQKWLDSGLTICPKTRQPLAHKNLIPNYTVKEMVSSWCEENNLQHFNRTVHVKLASVSSSNHISSQDLNQTDSFRCFANSCSSTSRSYLEVGNGLEKQKSDITNRFNGGCSGCQRREIDKYDHQSPDPSYIHNTTEPASSEIYSVDSTSASNDLSMRSKNLEMNDLAAIPSEGLGTFSPTKEAEISPWIMGKQLQVSETKIEEAPNGNHNYNRAYSSAFFGSGCDDLTTGSHVKKLVDNLQSLSNEVQTTAAEELRLLAKHNMENPLLNLSINKDNKAMIAKSGAIEPLIHVLKSRNDGAKENSAAALFSLSVLEECKARIGRSGAVKALARIVQAGAVKYMVDLMDPDCGMVDKAVALLSNLSTIGEGRLAIVHEGAIPKVLCHPLSHCLRLAPLELLVALSQTGTPRAKEKAQQLLGHFRNQREGATGKGKT